MIPITNMDDLQSYREQILDIANKHGATDVRVFGSVARGDATENSDIDLLVTWDYARISSWGGVGLDMALSELLNCKVDVISENGLNPRVKSQILEEAKPL